MSKKIRLVRANLFVKHDQIQELQGTSLKELQIALRFYISKRTNGKQCVSIVRVIPVLASDNTAEVELAAFNEDISLIHDTDAVDGIEDLINSYLDIDFKYITVKEITDPLSIVGELD